MNAFLEVIKPLKAPWSEVNWDAVEEYFQLQPKDLANIAGVTPAMYYAVKKREKIFSFKTWFYLMFGLALLDLGTAEKKVLEEAYHIIKRYSSRCINRFVRKQ